MVEATSETADPPSSPPLPCTGTCTHTAHHARLGTSVRWSNAIGLDTGQGRGVVLSGRGGSIDPIGAARSAQAGHEERAPHPTNQSSRGRHARMDHTCHLSVCWLDKAADEMGWSQ